MWKENRKSMHRREHGYAVRLTECSWRDFFIFYRPLLLTKIRNAEEGIGRRRGWRKGEKWKKGEKGGEKKLPVNHNFHSNIQEPIDCC